MSKKILYYHQRNTGLQHRRCVPFDQFELPLMTPLARCEKEYQQEEGFRRMICSHRAAYYIRSVQGKDKIDYFFAVRNFLEELRSGGSSSDNKVSDVYCDLNYANQKEWVSAALKVIARPFFTFDYRLRCVVMDLFLLLSEFLIKRTALDTVKERLRHAEKDYIKSANVKKKVGQCLKKTRPPALEKNQATWPKNA